MDNITTYYDIDGKQLGSDTFFLPISIYKGMRFTFHGSEGIIFEVVEWNYHKGHPDENAGLRVILKPIN